MQPRFVIVCALIGASLGCPRDKEKVTPLTDEPRVDAGNPAASAATVAASAKPASSNALLPGVDTSSLIESERKRFTAILEQQYSPCGEVVSVAQCVREARGCKRCLPEALATVRLVHDGEDDKAILDWLTNRFDDSVVKKIPTTDCSHEGPASAKVAIVELMDFECPHCAAAAPILRKIAADPKYASDLSLTVKMFPLSGHTHAFDAARAAVAAESQGKFFAMYDLLLANQDHLEAADLEKWARTAGVDVPKWKTAFNDPATKAHVETDKKDGETLGVMGVPAIYISGRKFDNIGSTEIEAQLRQWIDLDLALR